VPKLFSGSEGTLGVITGITLQIRPKPRFKALMIVEVSLKELDEVASILRTLSPAAIELVDKSIFKQAGQEGRIREISRTEADYLVFCEMDADNLESLEKGLEKAAESRISSFDPLTIEDPGRISEAWGIRNETLTLATEFRKGSRILVPGVEDLVVPPEHLGDLVSFLVEQFESRGLDYVSYGHAGDANLHMRPFLDPKSKPDRAVLEDMMEECFKATWKMGGSMTGEHGDGMLRAKYVERQYPKTYDIMRQIRDVYDPKRLLNPEVKVI
jgi:FAD/FMN-containing dehydrogenase